jgi:hypothetical protein
MTTVLTPAMLLQVRDMIVDRVAESAALSIADSGARAWQRGASVWDHGFVVGSDLAASWTLGWRRAAGEFGA